LLITEYYILEILYGREIYYDSRFWFKVQKPPLVMAFLLKESQDSAGHHIARDKDQRRDLDKLPFTDNQNSFNCMNK
jgi:hypothetical protein